MVRNKKEQIKTIYFITHTWEKLFKHSSSCNELVFNHPAKIEFTFNQNNLQNLTTVETL